jgi:hypothetical protein
MYVCMYLSVVEVWQIWKSAKFNYSNNDYLQIYIWETVFVYNAALQRIQGLSYLYYIILGMFLQLLFHSKFYYYSMQLNILVPAQPNYGTKFAFIHSVCVQLHGS